MDLVPSIFVFKYELIYVLVGVYNDIKLYRYKLLYQVAELVSIDLRFFLLIFLLQRLSVLLCKD